MTRPGHDPLTNARRLVACSTPRQRAAAVVFAANVVGLLVLPYTAFVWLLALNGVGALVGVYLLYREASAHAETAEALVTTLDAECQRLHVELTEAQLLARPHLRVVPSVPRHDDMTALIRATKEK